MIRVLGYLATRSLVNRLARQARQLRSPRYLAALLAGGAYLWFIVVGQQPAPGAVEAENARWLELVGALALGGAVAWSWVFAVERRVLAFSPAEVTFLFPAPVTRRALVQYKLLRSQLLILFNTALWTLLLSRERFGASPWLRAIAIWVLLTTLAFHRLGASFVRTSLAEHGRFGLRHRVVSLLGVGAVLIALTLSIADVLPSLAVAWSAGPAELLAALNVAAERPLPRALLAPFRIAVRPLAATTPAEWLAAIGPALALAAVHYVWVLRSDSAFEEAAAEASLARARLLAERRAGRAGRFEGSAASPLFRLAPDGWPGGAIVWKNLVAVVRRRRVRGVAVAFAGAAAAVAVLSFDPGNALSAIVGGLALTWAGFMVVAGPLWVRNDLRSDLLKLDLLRSYPLRGSTVVAAEAAASTIVLTALQLALVALAYLAHLGDETLDLTLEDRTAALLACVAFLPGVNYLGILIQNGAALLYPAWVHLGSGRPGGVEALGQNLLMTIAFGGILAAVVSPAAAVGGAAWLLLAPALGHWAVLPTLVLALATLGVEAVLGVRRIGALFERTDPAAAGIPL